MKAKNIKIGVKVVLKDSTAGGAEAEEARRKNQPFLYVAEFSKVSGLVHLKATPPAAWTGYQSSYTCEAPDIKKYKPAQVPSFAERQGMILGGPEKTTLFDCCTSSEPIELPTTPEACTLERADIAKRLAKEFAETMHAEIFAAFHEYRETQGNGVNVLANGADINKIIVKGKKAAKKFHKID